MQPEHFNYDNKIVRDFAIATIVWGIVGMSVDLLVALQLIWPVMNFDLQWEIGGQNSLVIRQ